MEAPFLPPVSACLFWCLIFAVCPNRASVKTIAHAGAADGDRGRTRARAPPGIPTAFWRSVGPSHNVFVTESFMDELAAAAKQDPVAYRLALLERNRAPKRSSRLPRKRPAGDSHCPNGSAAASPSSSFSRPIWRTSPKSK